LAQSDRVLRIGAFNNSPASGLRRPEVKHRTLDSGIAAVQVSGELDLASVGKLEAKIDQALAQGSAPLLIDFTDCGFIDSTVLSLLVDLRGRLGDSVPPRFAVVAQDQPLGVLRLTRLDGEMPVYPSLAEGLRVLEVTGVTGPEASGRPGSS
jgi:anti-anti-sigma factor